MLFYTLYLNTTKKLTPYHDDDSLEFLTYVSALNAKTQMHKLNKLYF